MNKKTANNEIFILMQLNEKFKQNFHFHGINLLISKIEKFFMSNS